MRISFMDMATGEIYATSSGVTKVNGKLVPDSMGLPVLLESTRDIDDLFNPEDDVECQDCHEVKKMKSCKEWLPFDAMDNEWPLIICGSCWGQSKHQTRIREDTEARERAYGKYSDDDLEDE